MADNVLKVLFQDQADAIREGLGDIGKIGPAEFPAKTREIVSLIGAGGSAGVAGIKYIQGKVEILTDGSGKITHNLGVLPDIIIVFAGHFNTLTSSGAPILFSFGFSEAFVKAVGGNKKGYYSLLNIADDITLAAGMGYSSYIENTKVATSVIHSANTMTALFSDPAGTFEGDVGLNCGFTGGYHFIAIGGLTPSGMD